MGLVNWKLWCAFQGSQKTIFQNSTWVEGKNYPWKYCCTGVCPTFNKVGTLGTVLTMALRLPPLQLDVLKGIINEVSLHTGELVDSLVQEQAQGRNVLLRCTVKWDSICSGCPTGESSILVSAPNSAGVVLRPCYNVLAFIVESTTENLIFMPL